MIYFTSDLHFGHKNIILYDNRPFTSVEEMDRELIKRWNNKVNKDDTVYVLGDISWYNEKKTLEIFNQLNGIIVLILGNHDSIKSELANRFQAIYDYKEIKAYGIDIVLSHYPILFYNKRHRGAIHLYGHIHNSWEYNMMENTKFQIKELEGRINMHNVGCMLWNYEPVSLDEILKREGYDEAKTV